MFETIVAMATILGGVSAALIIFDRARRKKHAHPVRLLFYGAMHFPMSDMDYPCPIIEVQNLGSRSLFRLRPRFVREDGKVFVPKSAVDGTAVLIKEIKAGDSLLMELNGLEALKFFKEKKLVGVEVEDALDHIFKVSKKDKQSKFWIENFNLRVKRQYDPTQGALRRRLAEKRH